MVSKTTSINGPRDGKKVFLKKGTCSRTFHFLLNREFGYNEEAEERASDALAGGILQQGHQCGMLWGASLAVGSEACRRCRDHSQAIRVAVGATRRIMASFAEREQTIQCREITHCDFSSKLSRAKYFLSGRFLHCFNMAQEWAPEAVKAALQGLASKDNHSDEPCLSCASEVARKMGACEKEMITVAGFAGGLGLSGAACGALAAAVWMNSLQWCREVPEKTSMDNPYATQILDAFLRHTDLEIQCSRITGMYFKDLEKHTRFLKKGGCSALLDTLSQA